MDGFQCQKLYLELLRDLDNLDIEEYLDLLPETSKCDQWKDLSKVRIYNHYIHPDRSKKTLELNRGALLKCLWGPTKFWYSLKK